MEDVDIQKLRLEEKRIDNDYRIREAELTLKREELASKAGADKQTIWTGGLSPVAATVLVAFVGLLGSAVGAFLQGQSNLSLEQQKFESALISKAIEPENENERAQRLVFYTKLGLIRDERLLRVAI